jgi:hypothetical protein
VTWPADFTRRYKVTAVVNWLEKTGTSADVEIALETGPGVVLPKARVAMPTGTSVGSGALLVVEPSAMTGTQVRRLTVKPSASTVTVGVGAQILVEDIGAS